jgi:Fic family protein
MPIRSIKFAGISHPYPVRHRRKVPFHPDIQVPADLSSRLLEIRRLDQELDRFILSERDYLGFLTDAISVNIHKSVQLEGNPLGLEEVRRLAHDSMLGGEVQTRNRYRREILNHLPIWMAPEAWNTPWTLESLQRLHLTLFSGVESDKHPGKFRTKPSAIYSDKDQELFIGAPPSAIEEELRSLLEWTNTRAGGFSPVVAASVFFHEFESIHPYEDGNGRVGRTLFHVYLQDHGLPNSHLCQVEAELVRDPELYYRVLGWTDHTGSYLELVDYFTDALLVSYQDAVGRFGSKDLLSHGLDENSKRLLARAKHAGAWFTVQQATTWLDSRSDQTVRRYLNELVELGALRSRGMTRSKRYRFADPLADVREHARAASGRGSVQTRIDV